MSSNRDIALWGVLGLIIFVFIWFLPWRFDTNDDVIMMWLVSGAYTGTPEAYAVFIHPILSWFFSKLYWILPQVQWYSIIWYFTLYASLLGLIVSVVKSSLSSSWQKLILIAILILWMHFTFFLQFTIVAGAAGFSGFLLFEKSLQTSSRLCRIFALILISFSILIRWETFVLFAFGFGLNQLISSSRIDFLIKGKKYMLILLIFCGLFLLRYSYLSNSEYADFMNYTKARASVFDHPVFYTLTKGIKLDLKSEWFYFSHAMMDGNSIESRDLIELKNLLDDRFYTWHQIGESFVRLKELLVFQNFKIAYSLVILLSYIGVFWRQKKKIMFCILWMSFMLVFNHFFIVNSRVYILFFLPLVFPILLNSQIPRLKPLIVVLSYFFLSTFLLIHLSNIAVEIKRRKLIAEQFNNMTSSLSNNQLVILEGFHQNFLPTHYTRINPVPFLSMGWISKSPFQEKALARFKVKKISDSYEFYLLGFDAANEFYFPAYMKFLEYNYQLMSTTSSKDLILFHYTKSY